MIGLCTYQHVVIRDIQNAVAAGHRPILVVAPTGSGKTVIGGSPINANEREAGTSLFIAHRRVVKPTPETLAWVSSRAIAWAKRRGAA